MANSKAVKMWAGAAVAVVVWTVALAVYVERKHQDADPHEGHDHAAEKNCASDEHEGHAHAAEKSCASDEHEGHDHAAEKSCAGDEHEGHGHAADAKQEGTGR